MLLQEKLNSFKEKGMENKPEDIKNIMLRSSKELRESNLIDNSPKVGDKLASFNLKNHLGDSFTLDSLIKKGPVVLTFYRGGWCPYCNFQLKAYQEILPKIKALGAKLVAITPELPDQSLSTKEKNDLGFEILTDIKSLYARELGLVFTLSEEVRTLYAKFGHDLEKHNGTNQFDLPFPATLIINTDGVVSYTFIDTDYTQRAEPDVIIDELMALVLLGDIMNNNLNDKLTILWTNADVLTSEHMVFMYAKASLTYDFWKRVEIIIWGATAKLVAENKDIQEKLLDVKASGVEVRACISCAKNLGVENIITGLGIELFPMGQPLTDILKSEGKLITI